MADKTEVEVVAAPAGAGEQYQFFKNVETGQLWKATIDLKVARRPQVNDLDAAPSEMAVTVVVSPCDANGKVLREDEAPIIVDAHTHTFTNVEMQEPDFDPAVRIGKIVAERIHAGTARLTGISKLNTLAEDWNKKAKLKLTGKLTFESEPEGRVIPGSVDVVQEPQGSLQHQPTHTTVEPDAGQGS